MGCSNFLAIAYRELRAVERQLHAHVKDLHEAAGLLPPIMPRYPISNLYGIEIDPFAVEIAKATLWMTHALVAREYGAAEAPLPLPTLDHLICADSLKVEWPEVEAIIGNPPFHGDRRLRSVVGDEYIDWLTCTFGVGVKDHCVYFFRKTHEHLKDGQRAGLVATNTISQAKNRDASLVWITENGGTIVEAVSTKPWSGDAKVHVSVVCWAKGATPEAPRLDGEQVAGITPSLTAGARHRTALVLPKNKGVAFNGFFVNGAGFVLDDAEAGDLLSRTDADYSKVVARYINGEDVVTRPLSDPSRWVIDFGTRTLEEADAFPAALAIVRERVKPVRDKVRRKAHRERWWQFAETRPGLVAATRSLASRSRASPVSGGLLFGAIRHGAPRMHSRPSHSQTTTSSASWPRAFMTYGLGRPAPRWRTECAIRQRPASRRSRFQQALTSTSAGLLRRARDASLSAGRQRRRPAARASLRCTTRWTKAPSSSYGPLTMRSIAPFWIATACPRR